MFDLPQVASRVFGTPLIIARAKREVILGILALRPAKGAVEPIDAEADPAPATSISVTGTLVSRSGYLATSGLVSTPIWRRDCGGNG
jgi:capsid assembly protease